MRTNVNTDFISVLYKGNFETVNLLDSANSLTKEEAELLGSKKRKQK